jgi:hypothetical protein
LNGTLLNTSDSARDTYDHARLGPAALMHFLNEVSKHLLADIKIGDDPILEWTYRLDMSGGSTDHSLRLDTDS